MLYRCPKCRYSGNNLDVVTRHIMRHDNPAPRVLTETYSADKNASTPDKRSTDDD